MMGLIGDVMRGAMVLSLMAVAQHGCSVKSMAEKAANAHKKGLTSYGGYSRALTGHKGSWASKKELKSSN